MVTTISAKIVGYRFNNKRSVELYDRVAEGYRQWSGRRHRDMGECHENEKAGIAKLGVRCGATSCISY